jgi:diguanylate cyclase (GGDEF)-like protein/PAS domain S-box-containing protein
MSARAAPSFAAGGDPAAAILVVDDDAGKRLSIAAVLEPLGYAIVEATSGEAALHHVMARTFAVILLDVQMPDMDGYETARFIRMRRESEHTPIIFITAHDRDEAQIPTAYARGAVDFIFAPIVPDVLRAKVSIFIQLFLQSTALERSLRDVTTLGNRSRDSEARTRAVLDNVADGIVTVDGAGVIQSFNRAASVIFGYGEDDAVGRALSSMIDPTFPGGFADGGAWAPMIARQSTGAVSQVTETLGRRRDGSTFPMELALSELDVGAQPILIGCLRDISARRALTDSLQHQALHDDLTDLPNRVLFADRVDHAMRAAKRTGAHLALLVMDLDDFKEVNDSLGHQHGDALLKLVAGRLLDCVREGDTVARLGGDEFGILLLDDIDLAGAVAVAWNLQKALEAPFLVDGHTLEAKASIGITLVPEHGDNVADLLRRADLAMYDSKRSGRGYALFAAEQEDGPARRLALLGDLRHCIEREELVLHYQPKIDLATRRTIGVEALIRWRHPSGRLVMPDEFMPEVERNQLIMPITEWVINEALRTLRGWRDDGYDLTMAVNLGARCLAQGGDLVDRVATLTAAWAIPPQKLTLELTENALIDTAAPGLIELLHAMEVPLSIDDFGTGYSSLVYLQRLPVAELKIDRSFVTHLATAKDDAVIVRATIDLAHNLALTVVAEGVEDEATMDLLVGYGCDEAQGYHFSRALPPDELMGWLNSSEFGCRRLPRAGASAYST